MDVGALVAVSLLASIASALNSPCPDLFHYDSADQPGQWTGTVTVLSDSELHGVWVKLIFDEKLTELDVGGEFTSVPSTDGKEYLIKNRNFLLKSATPTNVKITVKYEGNKAPNLIGYRLNAKTVCSAQNLPNIFSGDLNNGAFLSSVLSEPKAHEEFEGCGTVPLIQNEVKNEKAEKGQWPWQAAIYIQKSGGNQYVCGATLISSRHVLTAAHCVAYLKSELALPPHILSVYLNKRGFGEAGNAQKLGVERVLVHPGYRSGNLLNDLAVIQLAKPAIINDYVRPICLRNSLDKKEGFLVGYGINQERKIEDLAQAEVEIISEEECSKHSHLRTLLTDNVFCARYVGENSLCVGDSGTGLASSRDGVSTVWELRGVVTVGVALQEKYLCDVSSTVFLVDVANYLKWIQEVIS